jgi:hypothetical protein
MKVNATATQRKIVNANGAKPEQTQPNQRPVVVIENQPQVLYKPNWQNQGEIQTYHKIPKQEQTT